MPWWSPVRISQARKLSYLLEEGTGEAEDGWLPRGMNVCCRKQGGQVECGDVQGLELTV